MLGGALYRLLASVDRPVASLLPSAAASLAAQLVRGPSVLFELVAGPWLLLKGVPAQSPPVELAT